MMVTNTGLIPEMEERYRQAQCQASQRYAMATLVTKGVEYSLLIMSIAHSMQCVAYIIVMLHE